MIKKRKKTIFNKEAEEWMLQEFYFMVECWYEKKNWDEELAKLKEEGIVIDKYDYVKAIFEEEEGDIFKILDNIIDHYDFMDSKDAMYFLYKYYPEVTDLMIELANDGVKMQDVTSNMLATQALKTYFREKYTKENLYEYTLLELIKTKQKRRKSNEN